MKSSDPRFQNILITDILGDNKQKYAKEFSTDSNKLKIFFKKSPSFYNFIKALIGPGTSPTGAPNIKKIIKKIFSDNSLEEKIILNLGSGTKRIHPEIINTDIYPYKNVDFISDLKDIPIKDMSCDMVIVDSVLEHVTQPEKSIKEIDRILKPGGYVYVTAPFLYPFHASPNDFQRWTKYGLANSFSDFERIDSGLRAGPASSLQAILMHFFALPFSLLSKKLYIILIYFFMVIFAPLKILDILYARMPNSHEIASDIYFVGRKKLK